MRRTINFNSATSSLARIAMTGALRGFQAGFELSALEVSRRPHYCRAMQYKVHDRSRHDFYNIKYDILVIQHVLLLPEQVWDQTHRRIWYMPLGGMDVVMRDYRSAELGFLPGFHNRRSQTRR